MLLKAILNRESGYREKLNLDNIINDFRCTMLDNHCVEGQDFGDLVPPLACSFSKVEPHILAVADEEGGLVIYDVNRTGPNAVLQDWLAHTNAIFDMEWTPSDQHLLTASGDQTVVLWDIAVEEKLGTFRGHTSSVKTVHHRPNDRFVFATGARDGHIMLWDKRTKPSDGNMQPQHTLYDAHKCARSSAVKRKHKQTSALESHQSVTVVLFQDEQTLVSSGSVDGLVKMWDLRRLHSIQKSAAIPKHTFSYAGKGIRAHGFSSLLFDSSGTRLFASCTDNVIYQYDCASLAPRPVFSYRGHLNSTFYVKTALSPGDDYLLSGSSDGHAYVWRVGDYAGCAHGLATLKGHAGEVSAVAWCANDFGKIITLGDDNAMRFWRLSRLNGMLPKPNDQIGWTEQTRREIGVSMRGVPPSSPCVAALLKSPLKGTMLPASPAKVSLAVRRSLTTLMTAGRTDAMTALQPQRAAAAAAFGSSGGACVRCASPRKLQVTPTKQRGGGTTGQTSSERVKRKLCDALDSGATKRTCESAGAVVGSPHGRMVAPPVVPSAVADSPHGRMVAPPVAGSPHGRVAAPPVSPGAGSPRNRMAAPPVDLCTPPQSESARKSLFQLEHGCQSNSVRQSPTVDMPNYVFDPQPRTPVGKPTALVDPTARTPDWLTRLKGAKFSPASPGVTTSPKVRTPRQSKRRLDCFTTPPPPPTSRRPTTPSRSPLISVPSIRKYFSPKSDITKATK